MGRKKTDRSDKRMRAFESTKPLDDRLKQRAKAMKISVSALIRIILEDYFESRTY